jgi:hypothetical protein
MRRRGRERLVRLPNIYSAILPDGFVNEDESANLQDTHVRFVGGEALDAKAQTISGSTNLPVGDREPVVDLAGSVSMVTGTFVRGERAAIHAAIVSCGSLARPRRQIRRATW